MKRFLFLLLSSACSRSPETAPPVVAVEPVTDANGAPAASATPASPAPVVAKCEEGFVEIVDGAQTVRYELGREIVPNTRGAKHAYVEEVIHRNGEVVLHLEGLAKADGHGGHVSLSISGFKEPATFPAVFEQGDVMYMAPGLTLERDERRLAARVEITKWGAEGEWVEGTFGPNAASASPAPTLTPRVVTPSASASAAPRLRASGSASSAPAPPLPPRITAPYRGRFRVCRTADWRVRL